MDFELLGRLLARWSFGWLIAEVIGESTGLSVVLVEDSSAA